MRKQNAVIILKFDYRYITKVCIHAFLSLKITICFEQLPILLCAVKTVEGDFRFCWTITPNVWQTHKENLKLEFFIWYVHWMIYANSTTNYTNIDTQKSVHFAVLRTNTVICRALQALYTPQRCELMKTKTNNTNCFYRIFIVCRSPVSPVFWARMLLSYLFLSLPKQSPCTDFAITR